MIFIVSGIMEVSYTTITSLFHAARGTHSVNNPPYNTYQPLTRSVRTRIPPSTMATLYTSAANNANDDATTNLTRPPPAPNLLPKPPAAPAFSVKTAEVSYQREIKLTVEMPLKEQEDKVTDLALCFKR